MLGFIPLVGGSLPQTLATSQRWKSDGVGTARLSECYTGVLSEAERNV